MADYGNLSSASENIFAAWLDGTLTPEEDAAFMEQCAAEQGENLRCQTISPKMMEKLVEVIVSEKDEKDEEIPAYLFSKLKSARIVTSTGHGKRYFRKAEELMEKNKNRFTPWREDTLAKSDPIFVRRHGDVICELVMLNLAADKKGFTIINFTGDMDEQFMQTLSSGKLPDD